MHPSSYENMLWCYRRYAVSRIQSSDSQLTVLDVGSANHNGSYSDIFNSPNLHYLGMDLHAGPGVDIILENPYHFPVEDASADFVISGQMLEHCEFFWLVFSEMIRVLKPDGYLFLVAPSAGPIHRYPVDCYRYFPDAFHALAKLTNCNLIDLRHDERGPWNDLVGVFSRKPQSKAQPYNSLLPNTPQLFQKEGLPEEEIVRGARPYLEVLAELHQVLKPRAYLEIGVRNGRSLQLAKCPAIGIDPSPDLMVDLLPGTEIFRMTSDDFFELQTERLQALSPDFVFIDGMHLFEFALRDFMHVERLLGPETVVVIDDIYPNHPAQALRNRATRVWAGDIWRLMQVLQKTRPDLALCTLDASPTGLLVIAALNANNRVLWQRYNPLVRDAQQKPDPPPLEVLSRKGALAPLDAPLAQLLGSLVDFRSMTAPLQKSRESLRHNFRKLTTSNCP